MVCEIVINNISRHTDNIYHYLMPDGTCVSVGQRVIVPFGRGNKPVEGYVLGIVSESEYKNLKKIISLADGYVYFNEKTAELIKFLHHRYFSPYCDIIKAVLPRGVSLKMVTVVHLADKDEEYIKQKIKNSLIKERIVNVLRENGGKCALDILCESVGRKNITASVKSLASDKIIFTELKKEEGAKDRYIKMVSLSVEHEEAFRLCEAFSKRAKAQARVIEVLCENESVSLSELLEICETSKSVVDVLEKKNIVKVFEILRPFEEEIVEVCPDMVSLTSEQQTAVETIGKSIENGENKTFLINGVTGSGKTEVYLNLIEKCVRQKKQSLFLVPEISLTPQMVSQVKSRFGSDVAVIHSMLTVRKRYDEWKRINEGSVSVVVGARSAIFSPLKRLGLIIIDEEHEGTYKSESSPRYHTVEVARFRAKSEGATLVLASATPSFESYWRAENGKYTLIELKNRVNNKALPSVITIDMRKELENGNFSIFSERLKSEIAKNLKNKQQTILFLNKRGFSSFVSCRKCGYVPKCPNCDISLTYHKKGEYLVCHYCDYKMEKCDVCPSCGSEQIRFFGLGTQKVTEEIEKLFPSATYLRMDADTTSRRFAHEEILNKFRTEKTDILVGTQMITKGLDFENVTLVGVIAADLSLYRDDFRSGEKTFSLLAQVIGRAGRGDTEGRAVVQTYYPENEIFEYAANQNYEKFYKNEIVLRRQMLYPPFCEIMIFTSASDSEKCAFDTLLNFRSALLEKIKEKSVMADVFGVQSAPMHKINNKYRFRFIMKMNYNREIYDYIHSLLKNFYKDDVSIIADVNPVNMY